MTTEITLLGSFALRTDTTALTSLRSRRALAVLAYLLVQRQPVARQTLLEIVWSDKAPDDARSNLSWALSYFATLLPGVIGRDATQVWVEPDAALSVDLWRLDEEDEAVLLNGGELLEGFYFADSAEFELWLLRTRETIRDTLTATLHDAITQSRISGNLPLATRYANRLTELAPWSESGYQQHMLLLARQEKYGAATVEYTRLRTRLSEELNVAPSASTTGLHKRIERVATRRRLHLPAQPTAFVGRRAGIAQLADGLRQPDQRLLTLHALGGIGKTRLAIEVGRASSAEFLDGVHFVSLVGATDLAQAIVTALTQTDSIPPAPSGDLWQHLHSQLADRELLLILDNFEPLIAQAVQLPPLLAAAPHLKLLVTSRVHLDISAEQVVVLDGLTDNAAQTLFAQTAAQVRPQLPLQPAEQASAAQICQLVNGMPLGIELAASWLRVRPIDDIANGLAQTLTELDTTMRDVPPRQRSMQAVFDYSWAQLQANERTVLARLAVFNDPFPAAFAADVADASRAILSALSRHALLRGEGRMLLHPLVREFAWAKLDSAEKTTTTTRHLTHFAALIAQHEQAFHDAEQTAAVNTFASHHNDLMQAWSTALETKRWSIADQMMPTLDLYHAKLNRYANSQANAQAFAAALRQANETRYLGHALAYAIDWNMDDGTVNPERVEEMWALCQADGRPQVLTIAAFQLANLANNRHDYAEAWRLGQQLFQHATQAEMGRFMVSGLLMQANVSIPQRLNRPKEGQAKFRQALAIAQANGDKSSEAIVRHNIGFFLQYNGDFAEAEAMFAEVDVLQAAVGSPVLACTAAMMQVRAIAAQSRLHEAESLALQALERARDLTFPILIVQLLTVLATEIYPNQNRHSLAVTLAHFVSQHPDCSPQVKLHLDEHLPGISAELTQPQRDAATTAASALTLDAAIQLANEHLSQMQ